MSHSDTLSRFLQQVMEKPVPRLLFHYFVWEVLYMLTGLPITLSLPRPDWQHFLFIYGFLGSINFVLFYGMAFYVIPKFFIQRKKIWWLVFISIGAATVFTILKYQAEYQYFVMQFEKVREVVAAIASHHATSPRTPVTYPAVPMGPVMFPSYFGVNIWFSFIIVIIAFSYQLILIWYKNEKVRKDIENQKLQAELSFLKMQINPHFLFNALNNIYSISVLEKSAKTGNNIMKLSELIRYMLYEKEDDQYRVSLNKEINHINSFIDLQKLRHDGDTHIQFSIEGSTADKKIPPLLLFPLIENSFKHGLLLNPEKPVIIQLTVTEKELIFYLVNHKNNYLKDQTGGIGLANVRKRLSLLYPDRHVLTINEEKDRFSVELKLPL